MAIILDQTMRAGPVYLVDANGNVISSVGGGTGGGGDASAANQTIEIARLDSILAATDGVETLLAAPIPAGAFLIGKVKTKFIVVTAAAMTRAANVTPYTALDAVLNNATPGSVTAITLTLSDVNDDTITLERIRIASTDTGVAAKSFRIWLYRADPTASTGIVGGDNLAFSTKQGSFIGSMSGTFRTFSDGSVACCVPDEGSRIITLPTLGAKTVFALLQTLDAFTPSANSTTFTLTAEGFQGAA